MDGNVGDNDGLLILGATNAPWHLDPAFRRPGRFDRILFVPPPDQQARAQILRVLIKGKPVADIDYDHIAKKTDAFSGADLKALIDQTIEAKLRDAMRDGVPKPIATKDLMAAIPTVRPSTREWFSTARNYALYANQGGAYDEVLKYMKL
jgi:transitional endoplasmic reticulum ATPase